jgi:hypothetical protein
MVLVFYPLMAGHRAGHSVDGAEKRLDGRKVQPKRLHFDASSSEVMADRDVS